MLTLDARRGQVQYQRTNGLGAWNLTVSRGHPYTSDSNDLQVTRDQLTGEKLAPY